MGTWYKQMVFQGTIMNPPSWTIKWYVYMYNFMERLSFSKGIKIKDLGVIFLLPRRKTKYMGKVSLDSQKVNLKFSPNHVLYQLAPRTSN